MKHEDKKDPHISARKIAFLKPVSQMENNLTMSAALTLDNIASRLQSTRFEMPEPEILREHGITTAVCLWHDAKVAAFVEEDGSLRVLEVPDFPSKQFSSVEAAIAHLIELLTTKTSATL